MNYNLDANAKTAAFGAFYPTFTATYENDVLAEFSPRFIELYNQCGAAVDLTGWQLQYRSSESGGQTEWSVLTLEGSIPAGGFYLVRCAAAEKNDSPEYTVPEGDAEQAGRMRYFYRSSLPPSCSSRSLMSHSFCDRST